LPVALLCVVLLAACGKHEKLAETATPVASPDATNATYLIEGRTISLSNGKADEPAAPGSASRNVTTLTPFSATADIDHDGKPDIVVVLTNSPGGSGTFYYVAALVSSSSTPAMGILIGDRITVSGLSMESGRVTVSYLTRPEGVPFSATPSVPTTKMFGFADGGLTEN
jgi:Flp pilus assembly protein TadG